MYIYPRKLVNFLCELMYFYWKFLILETCYIPPHANRKGQDFIKGGRAPWPHAGYGLIVAM